MCHHSDVVFESCVYPVAVLNAEFCMTCSLLTAHQHILLDGYISANQRFYSVFLSKITKYSRQHRELNH